MKKLLFVVCMISFCLFAGCSDNTDNTSETKIKIDSIAPANARIGDTIVIYGSGFGNSQKKGIVTFYGPNASEILEWRDTEIILIVPIGSSSGKVSVIIDGEKSNEVDFNVIPVITSINPVTAFVGDIFTISGNGFAYEKGSSVVSFNGTNAIDYISWSYTKIKVKIPSCDNNGKVSVIVNGVKSNEYNFFILTTGEISDIDGNKYKTIQIGSQVWMAENLNVSHYRNGDSIPNVKDNSVWKNYDSGAWCYYDNSLSNGAIYGKLYNKYAVDDPRGLAPEGWHVPTDSEWQTLIKLLGDYSFAGGKLKETGTVHWQSPNVSATNESRFTALPGGYRNITYFADSIGLNCYFWSSDYVIFCLGYDNSYIDRRNYDKHFGVSVRCIKDN